jgi:hypothetical protein
MVICDRAGAFCTMLTALQEVSEAKWLPSGADRPDWLSKWDCSKEDSNEKKNAVHLSVSP